MDFGGEYLMKFCGRSVLAGCFVAVLYALVGVSVSSAQEVLPRPEPPFKGHIGRTVQESTKDFPQEVKAPKGAPNILLILTDDVGFGASSTFGGPIPTPTMDQLAAQGLRYTQFHTTALCSPTRAALLSGRNHHSNATGVIMELASGFPGYNSLMPKSNGTFAEVLRQNGYNTAWYGKNHNIPDWHSSQAGPFDLWPTGLGSEYFFDKDMADHAIARIQMLHAVAPDKPWVTCYAPGTAHAPHHAPKEWIAKFKGQFDQGWDKVREETLARQIALGVVPAGTMLTPRPKEIPSWDSLNADQKKLFARMMEVYAACLAYCDSNIGRVIQAVKDTG